MIIVSGILILWAVIYTINFGRWAWKQGEKRGAIGIWLVAVSLVVVPGLVLFQP